MEYRFRKLNPNSQEDMKDYIMFETKLNNYLKSIVTEITEEEINWRKMHFVEGDEATFFCECDDGIVGYINVCSYHVVNNKRPNDDIGLISDIMVDRNHSNQGDNALTLLKLGIEELMKNEKTKAIMVVQEDNENRFLHFSLADKILSQKEISRRDGSKTISYELLISNIEKIKELTVKDIMKRYVKVKKKQEKTQQIDVFPNCEI